MTWGDDVYAAYLARQRATTPEDMRETAAPKVDRYRSKSERAYAQRLDALRHDGLVLRWDYEPLKLRLAATCYYSPDFLVIFAANPDNIELHEVKGFWRDDARVKIKVAAAQFPYFQFRAVRYTRGAWVYENFRKVTS